MSNNHKKQKILNTIKDGVFVLIALIVLGIIGSIASKYISLPTNMDSMSASLSYIHLL